MALYELDSVYSLIRVRGANRIDFLHRMSTGNLLGIQPGQGRATVFTTPIGRMVDFAIVLAFADSLLLISGGYGKSILSRWLRKYIFFNDDVQLEDETGTALIFGWWGAEARDTLLLRYPEVANLKLYAHVTREIGVVVNAPPLDGPGYYLISPSADWVQTYVVESRAAFDDLRIKAGLALFPNEINEDYIPLEAGLLDAVSFSKGCYIGQEIIARLESRGQLAKRLVRLEANRPIEAGAALTNDGVSVGKVTSVTSDGLIALGYVRNASATPGQALFCAETSVKVSAAA
ncbi:MAG TPA: glycine cleavage system protein T [Anaerolineae bacterium]